MDNQDILDRLGDTLYRTAQEQVSIRATVEQRWLDDLDQYLGNYDEATASRLMNAKRSRAFVNITRPKTVAAEARLADMLFPSDDKNWAIQPTPVPELAGMPEELREQVEAEALRRSEAMGKEIDDALVEADYHSIARRVIHDACLYGTGVLKGPVVMHKKEREWRELDGAVYEAVEYERYIPGVEHVEIWNFFPDMTARRLKDCEFVFERRYISRAQLLKLAKRPGYIQSAIERVITEARTDAGATDTHISRLREMSGIQASIDANRYELWMYHGSISADDLLACGCDVDDHPMAEYSGVVEFIDGIVIRGDINADEMGEMPYSMMIYEPDDSSIFGYGVPSLLRNEQRIANAAWRMALDNAAFATGPQIVVNREIVIPADGSWELQPMKVWWLNSEVARVGDAFATHNIDGHQAELLNLYQMAKDMADDVTSLPLIAQGSEDAAPNTATGTSMLMNAANVTLRKVVKYFDDNVTEPFITRLYNWMMQYSEKPEIKGDYSVDARGSSALVVKEQQNQSLQQLLLIAGQPSYAPLTNLAALYRKAIQANHLNADDLVKQDAEIEQSQGQQDPVQQAEIAKLQAEIAKLQAEVTVKNVEGMYSAINAAKEVAVLPDIAPMADEVYKSAGGRDYNGYPLAATATGVPGVTGTDRQNTHPQYPPNPQVGMLKGIDT